MNQPVDVDIDATLVTAHSEKDRAAGTYKGGFGFAPIVAFVDRGDGRGEPLGLLLRPGNAAANAIVDNADVLERLSRSSSERIPVLRAPGEA